MMTKPMSLLLPAPIVQEIAKQAIAVVVCLAMLATAVNAAEADQLELVGIRVGMTVEQVSGQLQQRNLQVVVDQAKFAQDQDAFVTLVRGTSPGQSMDQPRERVVVQFTVPPNEPRAISVMRWVLYPQDQGPSVESVFEAMTDRFGNPALGKPGGRTFWMWFWGANGPVSSDPKLICQGYLQPFGDQGGSSVSAMTSGIRADKFARPLQAGCTSGAYAVVEGGIRLRKLMTVVVDFDAANKAMGATAAHLSKLNEAAVSRERDASKQVKPDI